jgi:CBS domain-containing protein
MNPMRSPSYASAHARMRWRTGILTCGEIGLEPPQAIGAHENLCVAAHRFACSHLGFLPVVEGERLRGALYIEDLLKAVGCATDCHETRVGQVASKLLPTVQRHTLLADAVRLMIGSYLRRVAMTDDHDKLVGFVTMSEAAAMADRDPAVRDLLGQITLSPSLWARRFR